MSRSARADAPHRVITFADADGTQIALYFDTGTNLLTKSETFGDHPVLGDTVNEVVYSDYRPVAGVQLAHRVVNRTAVGEAPRRRRLSLRGQLPQQPGPSRPW